MGFNKKFFTTGGIVASSPAAAAAFDPLQNFETVTYTGNGGTQKITGYIRKGASFNGSSSKIDYSSYTVPTTNVTFSLWFRSANTPSATDTAEVLYNHFKGAQSYGVQIGSTTIGSYALASGGAPDYLTYSWTPDTDWHHVAVTMGSTNGHVLYLDGTAVATDAALTSYNSGGTGANHIGTADISKFFDGQIDQFRIFESELTDSQVAELALETYASSTKSTTDFGGYGGVVLYELDEDANDTGGGGYVDGAAKFNGTNSYIDLSIPNATQSTIDSIFAWVKFNSIGTNQAITNLGDSTSDNSPVKLRLDGATNKIRLIATNSGGTGESIYSTTVVSADIYYNVGAVWTGSSWKLYINGVNEATTSSTTSRRTPVGDTVYIGQIYRSGFTNQQPLDGFIDEVRYYTDEITDAEAGYIANNTTASIPTSNLLSYYKLDSDATDEQGNYNGDDYNAFYNGTATNVNFLGMAFQPDLVWIKTRSDIGGSNHFVFDSIRGATNRIFTNLTFTEAVDNDSLTSFDSNGFTVSSDISCNGSGESIVAWCWKAGGAAVLNENGDINSQVSANQDAGFSIVSYTGNSSYGQTVGHGLNSAPELIIIKNRDNARNWRTYAEPLGAAKYINLDESNGEGTYGSFNGTAPTTTVFSTTSADADRATNYSGDKFIAYCFHSVDGYQKIGSYSGGSTSTISTGFKPRFIIVKRTNRDGDDWHLFDSTREGDDITDKILKPNTSDSEGNGGADRTVNFTSDGFNWTNTNSNAVNASGGEYIYLAIA